MDKLLTVVIPAYNIEKYEEQCLSSFVKPKALPEIEVLVVNDGSSDRTVEIAEKYVQKYPDIFPDALGILLHISRFLCPGNTGWYLSRNFQ